MRKDERGGRDRMRQVTVAVLCVLLWMVSPWPSYAEELVSREAGLDVTALCQ